MEVRCKKGLISKTWERCKTFRGGAFGTKKPSINSHRALNITKNKSLPTKINTTTIKSGNNIRKNDRKAGRSNNKGHFSIYVGVHKERFVIKTVYVNHPLFKGLLEEAKLEYGYRCDGPLVIPCDVDHFVKILMEVEYYCCNEEDVKIIKRGCSFVPSSSTRSSNSYHLLTPPRMVDMNV